MHAGRGAAQLKPLKPNLKQRSWQDANSIATGTTQVRPLQHLLHACLVWSGEHALAERADDVALGQKCGTAS